MKVTSSKTLHFPQYNWGIEAGEERELPEDKDAQKVILAHERIKESKGSSNTRTHNAPVDEEDEK